MLPVRLLQLNASGRTRSGLLLGEGPGCTPYSGQSMLSGKAAGGLTVELVVTRAVCGAYWMCTSLVAGMDT